MVEDRGGGEGPQEGDVATGGGDQVHRKPRGAAVARVAPAAALMKASSRERAVVGGDSRDVVTRHPPPGESGDAYPLQTARSDRW